MFFDFKTAVEFYLSERGMTQCELSLLLGRSPDYIAGIKVNPDMKISTVERVAKALGLSFTDFIAAGYK